MPDALFGHPLVMLAQGGIGQQIVGVSKAFGQYHFIVEVVNTIVALTAHTDACGEFRLRKILAEVTATVDLLWNKVMKGERHLSLAAGACAHPRGA